MAELDFAGVSPFSSTEWAARAAARKIELASIGASSLSRDFQALKKPWALRNVRVQQRVPPDILSTARPATSPCFPTFTSSMIAL